MKKEKIFLALAIIISIYGVLMAINNFVSIIDVISLWKKHGASLADIVGGMDRVFESLYRSAWDALTSIFLVVMVVLYWKLRCKAQTDAFFDEVKEKMLKKKKAKIEKLKAEIEKQEKGE